MIVWIVISVLLWPLGYAYGLLQSLVARDVFVLVVDFGLAVVGALLMYFFGAAYASILLSIFLWVVGGLLWATEEETPLTMVTHGLTQNILWGALVMTILLLIG